MVVLLAAALVQQLLLPAALVQQHLLPAVTVAAVVLAAMVGCSMLAVKFSSICCILICGAAGVLAYAVGQGKKGGAK